MRCALVIPAAGSAERLGGTDKTLFMLAGKPALEWVLRAFLAVDGIEEIAIAVSQRNHDAVRSLVERATVCVEPRVVQGGATRQESVALAVDALSPDIDIVVVHDAARPLVTPEIVRSTIEAASAHGAAIAAVPVTDTIKQVSDGVINATIDRSCLIAAQTPQAFRRDWLIDAYAQANATLDATDEAAIVELAGYPVRLVAGSPENIKITTPSDMLFAGAIMERRLQGEPCSE
jgi:2-C-methyl-D-erythritol 4-phosphate cytidylyltransferase